MRIEVAGAPAKGRKTQAMFAKVRGYYAVAEAAGLLKLLKGALQAHALMPRQ